MRRVLTLLALLSLLTVSASAAYVPEEVITENRDGRQLIIKVYTLSPQDDPTELTQPPFDLDGFHYEHMETVKDEQSFQNAKQHTETITLETDTDDLSAILAQLPPSQEYSKDGYGQLLVRSKR